MWRRFADAVMRRPAPPSDERSIQSERLAELAREVPKVNAEIHALALGARGRLDSYRRVREIGPRLGR